ncbi:MAG: hypothetical protein LC128_09945 [Chitinophagales bacterium]|nr:hypothetical protein [Chitinophagales bacterium]
METTTQNTASYTGNDKPQLSKWKRLLNWAELQENNRIQWISLAILGHGCFVTIFTIAAIVFSGNNFIYWPFAIAAMGASVVSYLAALPTKIAIPIFFISMIVDIVIIMLCAFHGFNVNLA